MFPLLLALTAATDPNPQMTPPCPPGEVKAACPKWEHYFQPSSACAGLGRYPFEKQPRVCPVAVCDCSDGKATGNAACTTWTKEFSRAAHIAFPRFNLDGDTEKGDALVIYEGMRLTVNPSTGEYDLTFTATVPNMPVTLRLQLEFNGNGQRYMLTLPPIRMQPKTDTRIGDSSSATFNIAHRGYSSLFLADKHAGRLDVSESLGGKPLARIDGTWKVDRHGTARFGTPVAIEDPNR